MAVTFATQSSSVSLGINVTSPVTVSNMTTTAGTNIVLVAFMSYAGVNSTAPIITSVTWGGTALSKIATQFLNGSANLGKTGIEAWGLVAPSIGNSNVSVSFSDTNSGNFDMETLCYQFNGVNQTGGATTFPHSAGLATANDSGAAHSLNLTSLTGNMTVADAIENASNFTAVLNGTLGFLDNRQFNHSSRYQSGAATVTYTWQVPAADDDVTLAIDIAAAPPTPIFDPTEDASNGIQNMAKIIEVIPN